jgi:AraC family transcriptional regulator
MELQTHGARKYPTSALLASSAGLGWSTLSVEVRAHAVSETPVIVPRHMELCVVVAGTDKGLVRRTGAGQCQEAVATSGAISLTPIGVGDNTVAITAAIPQTMHLYLPTALFRRLSDDFNLPASPAHSIRYAGGIHDEVIHETAVAILAEMTTETAAGRVFVETASLMLAARLIQKYCDSGSPALRSDAPLLDHVRLRRVLDYVSANIYRDITLADLARVAGLSPFHFARKFTLAMGLSPKRYISRMRLDQAMAELAAGRLPLVEIALNAGFSSQASFTRAFRRTTSITPQEYRRQRR